MEITQVLNPRTIATHVKAANKAEALEAMADIFVKENVINDKEQFLKDVYAREDFGATGIGNYIAIPHGKSEAVVTPGVAIAVLENEVEWESLDDTGAKVVILFAVGADNEAAQEHLKMLSVFSKKLGDDKVVAKLKSADTVEDVFHAFAEDNTVEAEENEEELDLDEISIM